MKKILGYAILSQALCLVIFLIGVEDMLREGYSMILIWGASEVVTLFLIIVMWFIDRAFKLIE